MLAGVSADYYTRLEKGNLAGVSDSILDAIAGALQLDEAERVYLFDLARTANAAGRPRNAAQRRRPPQRIRPVVQQILDSMTNHHRIRPQRTPRHPRHQPARPRSLLPRLRQPHAHQ